MNKYIIYRALARGGQQQGRGATRNRPTQGDDERYDLEIDFLEAVFGCEKELEAGGLLHIGPWTLASSIYDDISIPRADLIIDSHPPAA